MGLLFLAHSEFITGSLNGNRYQIFTQRTWNFDIFPFNKLLFGVKLFSVIWFIMNKEGVLLVFEKYMRSMMECKFSLW